MEFTFALEFTFSSQLPQILSEPALMVEGGAAGRIALLSEQTNQYGNPMLLALELRESEYHKITSFYGRENCRAYLERQSNVTIIDIERAKQLSRLLGLQLPMSWKVLNSDINIPESEKDVKPRSEGNSGKLTKIDHKEKAKMIFRLAEHQLSAASKSLDHKQTIPESGRDVNTQSRRNSGKLPRKFRFPPEIVKDNRASGFQPTKSLIRNIKRLDEVNGKTNTMKDICRAYCIK